MQHPVLQCEGNLGQFEGRMVERKTRRCSGLRGEAVSVDQGQATTPAGEEGRGDGGGEGARPDGITAVGQVSTFCLVTMGSEPGLSKTVNVYVIVRNEG